MDDVDVRAATDGDLEQLGQMAGALVRFHHAIDPRRYLLVDRVEEGYREWFRTEMQSPDARVLVAETAGGGSLLGYAYGRVEAREWNLLVDRHGALHDVMVRTEARGLGVGRALVLAFCEAMKALGAPRVLLHTAYTNTAAQGLFLGVGFRPTMVEMTLDFDDLKSEPHEGAAILTRGQRSDRTPSSRTEGGLLLPGAVR